MRTSITRFVAVVLLLCSGALAEPIRLSVDATEAPRRILHASLAIPVTPGEVTLLYPKWLPGEHGPTGPLENVAGLVISAAGQRLAWQRDPLEMYAIKTTVPAGASSLDVTLDFLLPGEGKYSAGSSATEKLLVLSWNWLVLYPAGAAAAELSVAPSLRLPSGWRHGSSLEVARTAEGVVEFAPVSLETLVDSPVIAGVHYAEVPLAPGVTPAHHLHMVADGSEALEITPATKAALDKLVREALALFGAPHYRSYHFLLTLSDGVAHFGLEHHESSDNRVDERTLLDDSRRVRSSGLLPHEMVHSWCGKYRRPEGLTRRSFQEPFATDLLWVYEGLTSYLGFVLTARCGLLTPDQSRELLAHDTSLLDLQRGRTWRPLLDTAVEAQVLFHASDAFSSWRRSVDFYDEGTLLWLEADVTIRELTKGQKSLDDFCRAFFGGKASGPAVVPYTYDDLVAALGAVAPHDWKAFFDERLTRTTERAPMGGIERGGWRLAYGKERSSVFKAREEAYESLDLYASLGFGLDDEEDVVEDVIPGSPAARAGLVPGMKLLGVDGRKWSGEVLRDALRRSGKTRKVRLLVESGEFFLDLEVPYADGERYPILERDDKRPDHLGQILAPRTR